jgi:hypothetical protein
MTGDQSSQGKVFYRFVFALLFVFVAGVVWAIILPANSADSKGVRGPDAIFAFVILGTSLLAMRSARIWHPDFIEENETDRVDTIRGNGVSHRHLVNGKMKKMSGLFARDVGPLTFDVATHSDFAEVSEYRGLVHWQRDVVEKILSLFLVVLFSVFLGRAFLYLIDFMRGDATLVEAIKADVHLAAILVGFALIVDGVLLVAAMTDAPGIGRTLDSLIVVLAGVIIIFFDPQKIDDTAIGEIGIYLILTIALLFVVRWIIRHHTIKEWTGEQTTGGGGDGV